MWNQTLKRVLDIAGSLTIILATSPVMLAVSFVILVRDGRPVLYKQDRIGLYGKPFRILKFRTMVPEERQKPNVFANGTWGNGVPDDFVFKHGNNPNVTPTGAFLRKYSMDELPQFFNVLCGTMSLVGPRPEIPAIADYYNKTQRQRLKVKPGITGLAQINGRSNMNNGRKMAYDAEYVDRQSFRFDILILFKTLVHVISGKNAI